MKKHNLFKVVGIAILVTVLLTWIIPTTTFNAELISDGTRNQVGVFDLLSLPTASLSYFGNIVIYLLAIGVFYGILHKIGAYRNLLDKIAKKAKGKEKIVLSVIMILLATFTSVCGASLGIWVIIPFIISLVLLMGYDKMTAGMVTVGSTVVGLIGTTFSSTFITSTYYITAQNGMGAVNYLLNTKSTAQIIPKVILLVLGLALLIISVLSYASKNHSTKKLEETELVPTVVDKEKKSWPLILIVDLMFVITLLALTSWSSVFNLDWFTKATEAVSTKVKIFGFPIFGKLLGNISAFESWGLTEISSLIILASIILAIIYKVKINDYIDNAISGLKKALRPATLVVLIYIVAIIVSSEFSPIVLTIVKPILTVTKGLNSLTMSLTAFISSIFNVGIDYTAVGGVLPYITSLITSTNTYSIIALIWQAMYGFMSLLAPTSIILMAILSYLDIPYGKWIKSNCMLILGLLALCLIVPTILVIML